MRLHTSFIRAGDAAPKWVREGLQKMLEKHFDEEVAKQSAISQPFIACGEEKVFHYSGVALGVRDKIVWKPEERCWSLKMGKEKEDLTDFCCHTSLRLSVDSGIAGDYFRKARGKALLDTCFAWNHIDGAPKLRMTFCMR